MSSYLALSGPAAASQPQAPPPLRTRPILSAGSGQHSPAGPQAPQVPQVPPTGPTSACPPGSDVATPWEVCNFLEADFAVLVVSCFGDCKFVNQKRRNGSRVISMVDCGKSPERILEVLGCISAFYWFYSTGATKKDRPEVYALLTDHDSDHWSGLGSLHWLLQHGVAVVTEGEHFERFKAVFPCLPTNKDDLSDLVKTSLASDFLRHVWASRFCSNALAKKCDYVTTGSPSSAQFRVRALPERIGSLSGLIRYVLPVKKESKSNLESVLYLFQDSSSAPNEMAVVSGDLPMRTVWECLVGPVTPLPANGERKKRNGLGLSGDLHKIKFVHSPHHGSASAESIEFSKRGDRSALKFYSLFPGAEVISFSYNSSARGRTVSFATSAIANSRPGSPEQWLVGKISSFEMSEPTYVARAFFGKTDKLKEMRSALDEDDLVERFLSRALDDLSIFVTWGFDSEPLVATALQRFKLPGQQTGFDWRSVAQFFQSKMTYVPATMAWLGAHKAKSDLISIAIPPGYEELAQDLEGSKKKQRRKRKKKTRSAAVLECLKRNLVLCLHLLIVVVVLVAVVLWFGWEQSMMVFRGRSDEL